MVVFFAVQNEGRGYRPGHVFGEPNLLYYERWRANRDDG